MLNVMFARQKCIMEISINDEYDVFQSGTIISHDNKAVCFYIEKLVAMDQLIKSNFSSNYCSTGQTLARVRFLPTLSNLTIPSIVAKIVSSPPRRVLFPGNTFVPNVFVDITDFIEKKLEIALLYEGEMQDNPYPRSQSRRPLWQ